MNLKRRNQSLNPITVTHPTLVSLERTLKVMIHQLQCYARKPGLDHKERMHAILEAENLGFVLEQCEALLEGARQKQPECSAAM